MKFCKLLLAVVGATVLLGALVASASANRLENSSQTNKATWTRMDFIGSVFGTVECEVSLAGSFHSRTITKTVQLIGYITEAGVIRCIRGGATVNRESLPWHREYRSFAGTLPNITGLSETVTGAEWRIREPTFGITCTVRRENSSTIGTYEISGGVVARASVSGESTCISETGSRLSGRLSGITERVEDQSGTGTRLTIRLI